MAYRYGNHSQITFFPPTIEEYVSLEDSVRAYSAFIDTLDLEKLGIDVNPWKVGNSEYAPCHMLKLIVYGYSYGWRSSRKLERATHHNVSFMWLMGGLKPDHKTIARFRKKYKFTIKKVLKYSVRLCIELDLIDGNILFEDGTKVRANAGRGKSHTKRHYKEQLAKLDEKIDQLLAESDRIDNEESVQESFVKMNKELADNKQLRERIKKIIERFDEEGDKTQNGKERTINLTDPESALMSSIQGSHSSFNVQSVVDDKRGLIVSIDAVKATSDINQFADQIMQAEEVTGKECTVAVADAGYSDVEELAKIEQRGTQVIVPSQRQALHNKEEKAFNKDKFQYDKEQNCYYCPEGQKLIYAGKKSDQEYRYKISAPQICKQCIHFGVCTQAKDGRQINRLVLEEVKEKLEKQYESQEGKELYKRRKARVEHPFGHIKHNLGMRHFLLRGREGAEAEISIAATCFNIARMITIFGGVREFINKLTGIRGNSAAFSSI